MASRAEPGAADATAGLGAVVRTSVSDFYFHSLQLVPANLLWGLTAIVLVFVGLASPVIAILASPLLAVAGMVVVRVAAGVARHEPGISIREAIADVRRWWTAAIALGVGTVVVGGVLVTNLLTGLASAEPIGWILATLAGWGLIAWWTWLVIAWPLVVDPAPGRPPAPATVCGWPQRSPWPGPVASGRSVSWSRSSSWSARS